jgi:hypothetical protein
MSYLLRTFCTNVICSRPAAEPADTVAAAEMGLPGATMTARGHANTPNQALHLTGGARRLYLSSNSLSPAGR